MAEKPLTESTITAAQKRTILTALMVVLLLSALDQTIVSTALPRIIEQLQGLELYAWVTTAYMLTSTVTVPIYGKLSDMYGRKVVLVWGLAWFLAGSALCGLAGEFGELPVLGDGMMQLVVFRAVQGFGGGALMTGTFAVLADLYPPRERAKLFGLFGAVFGLATLIGPLIGGFFTDHGTAYIAGYEVAGWRWIFYVNLPLGALALFMILFRMPLLAHHSGGRVDYLGAALLILAATPLLLALSFGGIELSWTAPRTLSLFAVAAVALLLFLLVQRRAAQPILPLRLFSIPTFRWGMLGCFVINMAFFGVVMFMPLYMQAVQGISATQSGLAMLPLMGGLIFSSTWSGRWVARSGRYKWMMVIGGVVMCAGVASLSRIGPETSTLDLAWRLALTGLGLGPAQTLFNLVIQNAAPLADLGSATSLTQFSRQMGGTVGVAVFGAFLTQSLAYELPKQVPLLPGTTQHTVDLSHAQSEAMDIGTIRARVDAAIQERYERVTRALQGDAAALSDVLGDTRLPEAVKQPLRDGGIAARVQEELARRAEYIEREIHDGPAGVQRLRRAAELPPSLKQQLASIPDRAFGDPEVLDKVAELFSNALLMQQSALVETLTQQALRNTRDTLQAQGEQLVSEIHRGLRVAFTTAIADVLWRSLWIVLLGIIVILFVPELPLHDRTSVSRPE